MRRRSNLVRVGWHRIHRDRAADRGWGTATVPLHYGSSDDSLPPVPARPHRLCCSPCRHRQGFWVQLHSYWNACPTFQPMLNRPMKTAVEKSNAEYAATASVVGAAAGPDASSGLKPGTPLRAFNALIPFGTIIAVTLGGMILDGRATLMAQGKAAGFVDALSAGNSILALLWGSSAGMLSAMTLLIAQRILSLAEVWIKFSFAVRKHSWKRSQVMETFVGGMKDVMEPGLACDR